MMTELKARTAPCIGCGRPTPYKTNAKVCCARCFGERKREKDRRAAEKQRRKRGVAAVRGTEIVCRRCARVFARNGIRARLCEECRLIENLERARATQARKSMALGRVPLSEVRVCQECEAPFFVDRAQAAAIYCSECMALRKLNKLPKMRASYNSWRRGQVATNPKFALNERMRKGIYFSLGDAKAGRHWESLVGYTVEDLMRHLERQFLPGMSWENRALWQIDHRQPLASFTFDSAESPEFLAAWHLSNLQPLWAKDNLEKRALRTVLI